jgi:ABC-type transport system substrate-binding protein
METPRRTRLAIMVAVVLAAIAVAALWHSSAWRTRSWDTLELAIGDNITTFDPALIKDVSGGRLAALLYPNLMKYSAEEAVTGDLADRWGAGDDARIYSFHIRQGARFSDGSPLTARDVAASFERALSPAVASPRAWVLMGIRGAEAFHQGRAKSLEGITCQGLEDIQITLERPSGTFLSLLTMPAAAVLPAATPCKPFWGVDTLPVAGGPWRIRRLEPDVAVTLEANPYYFGDKPRLAAVRFRIIKNPFAMAAEFRQGRLDVIDVPDSFDSFFRQSPSWQPLMDSVEGQNTFYLGFNCTRAPFDNRDFRHAASMAIDRKAIIDGVLRGRATAAVGPIPPGVSGYDPALKPLPFDREAAKKEFARLGATGRALEILVMANADSIVVAQAIAGQFKAAGLSVEVAARERGTFKSLLAKGDFDMVYYSWVADYADGENFLAPLFATAADRGGGNYTAYSNPEVDALVAKAAVTAAGAERGEICRKIAGIVISDAPRVFLWHSKRVTVKQPWVKGFALKHVYNAERFTGVSLR